MSDSTKHFFGGGGGAPGAKFPSIGTTVGGFITKKKESIQTEMNTTTPKLWPDGQPMTQVEVTVLTDDRDPSIENDDGTRRIYVKGYMTSAVTDALAAAGADDVEVGGTLFVTYVKDQPAKTRGHNPAKLYQAKYTKPSASVANGSVFEDEEPF